MMKSCSCRNLIVTAICILTMASDVGANEAVTNAIHRFMETLYSNDKTGCEATIIPHPDIGALIGKKTLAADDLKKVKDDVARLQLRQTDPYRHMGKVVKADGKGNYPVGTKATFMTGFRGVALAIPVENTDKGWKIDVRYWLAGVKEYSESDPEIVAKKFLFHLIVRDRKALSEVSVTGSNLDELSKGEPPAEDQYACLAMEMPVVEAHEGEGMLLPGGDVMTAGKGTPDHKWMVGMYGPNQLVFEMKREGKILKSWKVVPQDYPSVIGIGQVKGIDSDSLMEQRGPRKRVIITP